MIGRDTRPSGWMLENALAAGLQSAGLDVVRLGVIPTPGVAALVRHCGAVAGAVISASHNPAGDNGVKFFASDGYKLPDALEVAVGEAYANPPENARSAKPGGESMIESPVERYLDLVREVVPEGMDFAGMKLVVDGAEGAAHRAAPEILRELDADIVCMGCEGDGSRINHQCGSTEPEALCSAVVREGAHAGVAFDGDADRLLMVDETGSPLDGDELLAILATDLLRRDRLPGRLLVATVMSNFGLETLMRAHGGRLLRTAVGDRHVIEAMREHHAALGGEQSGHLILHDHATTGDGIVSALAVLGVMRRTGLPLGELRRVLVKSPQAQRNLSLNSRPPLETVPGFSETRSAVEAELGSSGRVLVRYSGTESKVRILVEGNDAEAVGRHADRIAACFTALRS